MTQERTMRRRIRIIPYGPSNSAKLLSRALRVKRIKLDGTSRFLSRDGDVLINWGRHNGMGRPLRGFVNVLNGFDRVAVARDKLACFKALTEARVPTVEWTTDRALAFAWAQGGHTVFARHSTTGQGGSGIEIVDPESAVPIGEDDMPDAPLYTKRFRAEHEYRVHVFGPYHLVQKKRRRNGAEPNAVRNHRNGYVYCTLEIEAPNSVTSTACSAVAALGLDFAAVDLMCNNAGEVRVLEVNTAPGIEGSTLDFYVERFREKLGVAV